MSFVFDLETSSLPWEKWSWDIPQEPIAYFFRRHSQMPIKKPDPECQCPPHKECTVEYKFNEDALHFLNLKGLLNKTELQLAEEEAKAVRRARNTNRDSDEGCCCPPRTVMMPTFITEKRFDEVIDRFNKKKDTPSLGVQAH